MDEYFDLGSYRRQISTENSQSQIWFNRGLIWSYGFNHEEAAECFRKASAGGYCLMALWGIAYSIGPNYNKPWEFFDPEESERTLAEARTCIKTAKDGMTASNSTDVERALIHALQFRYEETNTDRSTWNSDYAQAMEDVYRRFPDDMDVAAVYADALMNLTPWSLWDLRTGKPAEGSRTIEAKSVIERALALTGGNEHPGLLHLYIHLMEMSPTPEAALPAADRLLGLVPDAGHLHHMPTHVDVLCGDYRRVVTSNSEAIRADQRWVGRRSALNFYTLYRCHNYHFKIYGAMFAGMSNVALETAAQLEEALSHELFQVRSPPMADWLESFLSMRLHVLIRFGRWEDITELELPKDQELYCVTTAMAYYAKSVALANLDQNKEAEESRELFHDAVKRVPDSRTLFNNTCQDLLKVASAMLDGEIEYRRGRTEAGFEHLRKAIELSDTLPYDERLVLKSTLSKKLC
jgi:tetratricopeptide (TPR) repeat protein